MFAWDEKSWNIRSLRKCEETILFDLAFFSDSKFAVMILQWSDFSEGNFLLLAELHALRVLYGTFLERSVSKKQSNTFAALCPTAPIVYNIQQYFEIAKTR